MMNRAARKALISGCGVAGPVVALFLQRAGIEAEIYETRASSTDYGDNFLNMACNGLDVLGTLGLDEQVEVGAPSINLLRTRLHQVLREEAEEQRIKIAFDKKLADLESGAQGVVATFADGSALLVGCDGIHSRARCLVNSDAPPPHDTGLIGTGGFAPHEVDEGAEDLTRL